MSKPGDGVDRLMRQLTQIEAAIGSEISDQVDVVIDSRTSTPLLLKHAQKALLSARDGLERQVQERTAELQKTVTDLEEITRRYELVIASSSGAIWDWDLLGRRVMYSPQWKALRGFGEDEVGDGEVEWRRGIHPEDAARVFAAVEAHLQGVTPVFAEEYRIRCKDGSWKWIFDRGIAHRDATGRAVRMAGSEEDITDRKMADEALQKANEGLELRVSKTTGELSRAKEELEAMNRKLQAELEHHRKLEAELVKAKEVAEAAAIAKSQFMASMSHELRTPMNAVIGMTGLLLMEDLTAEQRDYVETIRQDGEALMALINEVLDFSRMERELVELEIQPFDLRNLVEEALDLVSVPAAKKGLELAYLFDQSVPEAAVGDPARLKQVLDNLLSNAVKFTDKGEVALSVSRKDENLHFAVRDTGLGIPRGQMHRLFQPFSQLNMSLSRGYNGAGLGLAISQRLVVLMGGSIWVSSEPGKGSTFYFTIKAEGAPAETKPFLASSQPLLQGKSVLILSAHPFLLRMLADQVQRWGMTPMLAESAQEALRRLLAVESFDLAIADLSTPDAVSVLREIVGYNEDLPLVALTSAGQKLTDELQATPVTKPIKPARLHQALSKLFSGPDEVRTIAGIYREEKDYGPLRILLAEDNISNQKMTLLLLKKLGYRADLVSNGREALAALERQSYDIILMDVKMPLMNGLEATRAIRQRWPEKGPKIIALTAFAMPGDEKRCIAAGMDGYLCKPVQIYDLAEILNRCREADASSSESCIWPLSRMDQGRYDRRVD